MFGEVWHRQRIADDILLMRKKVRRKIQRARRGKVLSEGEVRRLITKLRRQGVSENEIANQALRAMLGEGNKMTLAAAIEIAVPWIGNALKLPPHKMTVIQRKLRDDLRRKRRNGM